MSKHLQKLCALVLVCCAWFGSSTAWGQVNLQQSPYTENFDGLTAGYPTGWTGLRFAGSNAATVGAFLAPGATDGSANSGGVYSVGLDTDRAMGSLASGSTAPAFGASFTNTTGSTLNQIKISAVMEQWRSGSRDDHHEVVTFAYSLNATSLNDADATWTEVTELNLNEILTTTTAAVAVDGNATANKANITSDINALNWANNGTLWIRWVDVDNIGSDGIYAIDDFKIEFESNSTTPGVFAPSSLNLGETLINAPKVSEYTFTASNLTAGVTVTADAPFTISKTADGTFTSEITFTAAELSTEKKVFVKALPTTEGIVNGNITHTSAGATDAVVAVTLLSQSPYVQNFNNCTGTAALTGGWMQYSVAGAQNWACTTFGTPDPETGKMTGAVQMSGFDNGNNANEDWLISPKLDLSGFTIPLASVNYRTKYAGNDLKVMVSTNYSGAGDPTTATWEELVTFTADDADAWKVLENLGLQNYRSANTYIAFVYTSTTESAARWTLDNFEVKDVENFLNTSNIVMNFPETASGNTSDAMKFTFSAVGFAQDVVLSVPANFELSKDGTTYAATLTYTNTEAAAENEVFVRFAPSTTAHLSTGPVTFTSGETVITRGVLSGSSLLKSGTLDVVTWNMEWFGSTSSGPSDEELQFENAKKVLQHLNADIIGVQEVSSDALIAQLAAETGYTYITKPVTGQQQIGFLYKADVVTVKKDKLLLAKLYADVKANTVTLENYPTSSDDLFWASGRLPYLAVFEANIGGVKQTLHVVNLHAKATMDNPTEDYSRRLYDAKVLSDSLAAQYANVNLILLGDFNDDVDVSVVGTDQKSSFDVFVADEANYTTLTMDLSKEDKVTYESSSLRSFLDHIFISNELTDEYVANSIAIEEQLLNLIPNFRTNTSDHLPVSARFIVTADPAAPATVSFATASVSKAEDAGTFTVSLTLSEGVATEQTVTIAPKAGATASAADYTITGAENGTVTVTIPANATTASFDIAIVDDTETEDAEQVVFEITGTSSGLEVGTAKTYTLTIEANDAPTGIADGTKGQFSVYPTIVNGGNVRLLLPERVAATAKVTMVVYSAEGRKVMNVTGTQDAVQAKLSNSVSNLPSGMYMILIETGKEFFQTKMVKR